jgi:hypothetical protein
MIPPTRGLSREQCSESYSSSARNENKIRPRSSVALFHKDRDFGADNGVFRRRNPRPSAADPLQSVAASVGWAMQAYNTSNGARVPKVFGKYFGNRRFD